MLVGRYPFADTDACALFSRIRRGRYPMPTDVTLSPQARCLIRSLLTVKPEDRLTADEAVKHPWFRCVDGEQQPSSIVVSVVQDDSVVPQSQMEVTEDFTAEWSRSLFKLKIIVYQCLILLEVSRNVNLQVWLEYCSLSVCLPATLSLKSCRRHAVVMVLMWCWCCRVYDAFKDIYSSALSVFFFLIVITEGFGIPINANLVGSYWSSCYQRWCAYFKIGSNDVTSTHRKRSKSAF